ncbi:histidine--tRNA ligase [Hyphococcus flavus]|uniref:Histidine--tRNA ligase n=1 Tax=Hyphococcus flavus TaxID=1866326 RepID=A0AAF0CH57_9PROT|nr:histidine--tRNA ligase [Hyphococcus flavus]WDI33224.1 histidine--tRNA ligase [Hyphococcus flavus]
MTQQKNKKQKTFRPKARIPRGFRDRLGTEIVAEREMLARISAVYEAWGFDPLETPAFEYTDALGKFLPDVDRPNQGVFSLQDDDEQWMSLRYDLTAPLARYVAENYDALPKPFRRYQVGPVWRNEKPGPGRFRQFTQCDADTVGAPAPYADAEICALFGEVIEAAGISTDDFFIRVSNRKIVDGLFEKIGLEGDESLETRLTVMRSMDKFDKFGAKGVALLLGPGRKDESGDFTDGAGLDDAKIETVLSFLQSGPENTTDDPLAVIAKLLGDTKSGVSGLEELNGIKSSIPDFDARGIIFDCSVIRGLDYYTGPVFEAEFKSTLTDAKGRPVQMGSIGGGGRYDGLVKRFKGMEVPAVGVSVGVSRLLAALELKKTGEAATHGPVVVLALEKNQMAEYQKMAAELRTAGIRAEVYLGGSNFAKQLKYADKRAAPIAIIQGEDERNNGEITIKDLVKGAELSKQIEDNKEWREEQPAQFSVKRSELVVSVKKVLAQSQD